MDEDKDYGDTFYKDDRNRQGGPKAKKRSNVREVRKRFNQMGKRHTNSSEKEEEQNTPEFEEQKKQKRYGNGKPQRQLKVQEYYVESEEDDTKIKKQKKNYYNIRKQWKT